MSSEKYNRMRALFLRGLEFDSEERDALLERECADDDELREEVLKLWRSDDTDTALPRRLDAQEAVERADLDLTGETAGPYRILGRVGEGGMGSVYRAVDVTLDREAALKFLSPHLLGDASVRSRFAREAKAAAALDHPNICAVYGTGDLNGHPYIATAWIEGRTLRARMGEGSIPLDEALDIATQIARGLAAAHAKGVVHRDVKPSNLMLVEPSDAARNVKIIDFGIAHLADATRITLTAAAMGTVSYMAPEQTFAENVDHRADIWSLGVVLYEMVAGRRPFGGEELGDVVDAIRTQQPQNVSSLRPALPAKLDAILQRALAKSPDERYQNPAEIADDLEALQTGNAEHREDVERRRSRLLWGYPAAAAVVVAAFFLGDRSAELPPEPLAPRPLTSEPGHEWGASLSPDGQTIAYSAAPSETPSDSDLFLQVLAGGAPLRLAPTSRAEFSPAWSPDGTQIAFLRTLQGENHEVFLVPALGGVDRLAATTRAPEARQIERPPPHLDWAPDGESLAIVDRPSGEQPFYIASLNLATGAKQRLTEPPANILGDLYPRFSPDGSSLAFVRFQTDSVSEVMVADLGPDGSLAGSLRAILHRNEPYNASPTWTPDGRQLLFTSGSARLSHLWATPADLRSPPRLLMRMDHALRTLTARAASDGERWLLVFVAQSNAEEVVRVPLAWRDGWPTNDAGADPEVLFPSSYEDTEPSVSPDGRQVAFISTRTGSEQLWIGDLEGGPATQATRFEGGGLTHPRWSPDGTTVALAVAGRGTSNIYLVRPDGSAPEPLAEGPSADDRPEWSIDGRSVYFRSSRNGHGRIWKVELDGGAVERVSETSMDSAVEPHQGGGLIGAYRGLWKIAEDGSPAGLGGEEILRVEAHPAGVFVRSADHQIQFYRYGQPLFRSVHQLPPDSGLGFSVSADLKWLYFSRPRQPLVDIMLAENLRESLR